jgi:hypothetical protein
MADLNNLIRAMQQVTKETAGSTNMAGIIFGTVISVSPLKINVEQRFTLESAQLILSRNVTDHTVEMTVAHFTDEETQHIHAVEDTYTGGGTSSPTTHLHGYTGRKKFLVHNGLVKGEKVLLFRVQGGQKYVVWDRVT